MRILRRGRRRGAIAVIGAAIAIAAWTQTGTDFPYRGDTVAVAAPEASGDIASLLDQVTIVDRVDQVPGYERSCKKGKAPLTELTARFAQV